MMRHRITQAQLVYLFLVLGCALVLTTTNGCGDSEYNPTLNTVDGQVETVYTDEIQQKLADDREPPRSQPAGTEQPATTIDQSSAQPPNPTNRAGEPIKPTFQSNEGTGSEVINEKVDAGIGTDQ